MFLVKMFSVSLGLTLALELPAAWLMGIRRKNGILLVILVNVLTNPAAVLLCWLGAPQLPVELGVIALEAAVYALFAREAGWKIRHPIEMSVICNLVSWITGMLIQTGG